MGKKKKEEKKSTIKNSEENLKPNKSVSGSFSLSNESVEEYDEALDRAKNEVLEQPKKKSKLWTWCFLFLNIAIVAGIFIWQFSKGEVKSLRDLEEGLPCTE